MGKILKNLSILQKFLFINLLAFIVLGIFTFFYLATIQKDLISEKEKSHTEIINQTIFNLDKSDIKFTRNGINEFLFSKKLIWTLQSKTLTLNHILLIHLK